MLGRKMWNVSRKHAWRQNIEKVTEFIILWILKYFWNILKGFLSQMRGFSGILSSMTSSVIGPEAVLLGYMVWTRNLLWTKIYYIYWIFWQHYPYSEFLYFWPISYFWPIKCQWVCRDTKTTIVGRKYSEPPYIVLYSW